MRDPLTLFYFGRDLLRSDGLMLTFALFPSRSLMSRDEEGLTVLAAFWISLHIRKPWGVDLVQHSTGPGQISTIWRIGWRWPIRGKVWSDSDEIAARLAEASGWPRELMPAPAPTPALSADERLVMDMLKAHPEANYARASVSRETGIPGARLNKVIPRLTRRELVAIRRRNYVGLAGLEDR